MPAFGVTCEDCMHKSTCNRMRHLNGLVFVALSLAMTEALSAWAASAQTAPTVKIDLNQAIQLALARDRALQAARSLGPEHGHSADSWVARDSDKLPQPERRLEA